MRELKREFIMKKNNSEILEQVRSSIIRRGELSSKKTEELDLETFDNKNIVSNQNLRSIDKVPFFLPRIGMNRTLPKVDVSSRLIKLSKKILNKDS